MSFTLTLQLADPGAQPAVRAAVDAVLAGWRSSLDGGGGATPFDIIGAAHSVLGVRDADVNSAARSAGPGQWRAVRSRGQLQPSGAAMTAPWGEVQTIRLLPPPVQDLRGMAFARTLGHPAGPARPAHPPDRNLPSGRTARPDRGIWSG